MLWAWPTLSPHEPLDVSRDTSFSSHTIEDVAEGVEATRILVVADPHIQCTFDKFEPWLYRWDSDRYLRQALGLLLSQLQPEVVVVVGDVFAEGYKASDTQWEEYLQVDKQEGVVLSARAHTHTHTHTHMDCISSQVAYQNSRFIMFSLSPPPPPPPSVYA